MNEDVRAELGRAAEEFWRRAPWQTLTDEEHFGIRDAQTGMYACCVILGHAGHEYGLGLYLYDEGFEVSRRQRTSEMDRDEFAYETELILLSFNRPGEVPKAQRKGPVALAPILHGGTRIIPTAFRKARRRAARPLDDKEAVFLTRALQLVVQLLESKRLGGLRLRNPKEVLVFVLGSDTGAPVSEELRKLEETQPPARAPFVVPRESRTRLVSIKPRGILAVAWATPGISVQGEEARALLVLDVDDEFVLIARAFGGPDPLSEAALHLIEAMEGKIPSPTGRAVGVPRQVVTDSLEFYEYMKDALADLGINVIYQEHVPPLEKAKTSLSEFMRRT